MKFITLFVLIWAGAAFAITDYDQGSSTNYDSVNTLIKDSIAAHPAPASDSSRASGIATQLKAYIAAGDTIKLIAYAGGWYVYKDSAKIDSIKSGAGGSPLDTNKTYLWLQKQTFTGGVKSTSLDTSANLNVTTKIAAPKCSSNIAWIDTIRSRDSLHIKSDVTKIYNPIVEVSDTTVKGNIRATGNVTANDSLKTKSANVTGKLTVPDDSLIGPMDYKWFNFSYYGGLTPTDSVKDKRAPADVSNDSMGANEFRFCFRMSADTEEYLRMNVFDCPKNAVTTPGLDSVWFILFTHITAKADSDSSRSYSWIFQDTTAVTGSTRPTVFDTVTIDSVTGGRTVTQWVVDQKKIPLSTLGWATKPVINGYFINRADKANYRADNDIGIIRFRIGINCWIK
jgi:hypothetical protein